MSDTGAGMDAETAAPDLRAVLHDQGAWKGTGLGLSTVFGIVKQSGGDISVDSRPGQGTTFKIYLPRVHAMIDEVELPAVDADCPRGSETILLVDDEDIVRRFVREVLTQCGYSVLAAGGAEQALEVARAHPSAIHMLLTDVVMPRLSGPELSERLTQERPGLRTLYTSGYAPDAIAHHGVLEPGISFLSKPLNRSSLAQKVREVLDLRS